MAGIMIYSDKDELSFELLSAANLISGHTGLPINAVCINNSEQAQGLAARGAETYLINNEAINLADSKGMASALESAAIQLDANIILLSSNRRGKELSGRLAEKLAAGCLTDVGSIKVNRDKIECMRNSLGGAVLAAQMITSDYKIIAVESRVFEEMAVGKEGPINNLKIEAQPAELEVLEERAKVGDTANIESANILVAVGQGLKSENDMLIIKELAEALGAEIACSKPVATDKKWLPEERIIGLSGKKCKPDLAVILGISGQVQFTVGIRDARTIVAVNTDENALIMQMADYIMVADLHDLVPEMTRALLV